MDVTGTIDTRDSGATGREVRRIYSGLYGPKRFDRIEAVIHDVARLFEGSYPGYQQCDTAYHDFEHSLQAFLAAARIFDGIVRTDGDRVSEELVALGLVAALGHDSGFIRAVGDDQGRGGKYTLVHVERSREFMGQLLTRLKFDADEILCIKNAISCTGLNVDISKIPFASPKENISGWVVGTADYLGQMSDPLYVDKLPGLYEEYVEGGVAGFCSADDLIKKTPKFFEDVVMGRLEQDYRGVHRFAAAHFGGRDVYIDGIRKNIAAIRGY